MRDAVGLQGVTFSGLSEEAIARMRRVFEEAQGTRTALEDLLKDPQLTPDLRPKVEAIRASLEVIMSHS